jgi:hypothetical protein
MKTSLTRAQPALAAAACLVAGVLSAGPELRAADEDTGAQVRQVFAEKLPKVPASA